ncbi:multicopper oxidase [Diaporthe amygdali]|uniref:multicopper oxidase n=1 Tax=Phomopsis amygdali TaxID=1214568 RepID=UPI0022FE9E7E|nr:multicopper oxidase [Diaporthe amygdali]KAJ0120220.1 multicopper oxidase [Diaporthe amygdali]
MGRRSGRDGFHWKDIEDAIANDGDEYFNLFDPPYRDGFTLYGGEGHLVVVRYEINFPAFPTRHGPLD